jgi:hypothetical protein
VRFRRKEERSGRMVGFEFFVLRQKEMKLILKNNFTNFEGETLKIIRSLKN